jgi:predicted RND superfamily exporter protein
VRFRKKREPCADDIYLRIEKLEKLPKKLLRHSRLFLLKANVIYGLLPDGDEKKEIGGCIEKYRQKRHVVLSTISEVVEEFRNTYYANALGYESSVPETLEAIDEFETELVARYFGD